MPFSQFQLERPLGSNAGQRPATTACGTFMNGLTAAAAPILQTVRFENETLFTVEQSITSKSKAKASKQQASKARPGLKQASDRKNVSKPELSTMPPQSPDESTQSIRKSSGLPGSHVNAEAPGSLLPLKDGNAAKSVAGKSRKRKAELLETAKAPKVPKEKQTKFKPWDNTKQSSALKAAAAKAQKEQDDRDALQAAKALLESQNQVLKIPKVPPTSSLPTTVFRTSRPILTRSPLDVWRDIFAQCPLEFLIKARAVCRDFRVILSSEVVWKQIRLRNYGPDCPDPPPGMTEMQYADLLTGRGCQTKGCLGKARKTYWAFQRRWCDGCLKKKVIMSSSLVAINEKYPRLLECIHHANFDIWDSYVSTGTYDVLPKWIKRQSRKLGYERLTISKAIDDIDGFLQSHPNRDEDDIDEIDFWYRAKSSARDEYVKALQRIETWVEEHKIEHLGELGVARENRAKFYEEKAKMMIPPLDAAVLRLCPSYKQAMGLVSKLNDRNWKTLQAKLEAEREAAEEYKRELEVAERAMQDGPQNWREEIQAQDRRRQVAEPASKMINEIATRITLRLNIGQENSLVADPDIVPVVLREVYREYHQLDDFQKPHILNMPYLPSIQDSRTVYQEVIKPCIGLLKDVSRIEAARTLKCPLCKRKDVTSRFEYEGLLLHVSAKHAAMTAGFEAWRPRKTLFTRQAMIFAWDQILWPINLPIAAMHHTATGKWNLNEDTHYVAATPPANCLVVYKDAFAHRQALSELGKPNNEFVENVIYAAQQFKSGSLSSTFIAQVAFQYALQKYRLDNEADPDLKIWRPLHLALLRVGLDDLFDGFQCQFCHDAEHHSKNNRFLNKGQPFADLMRHYEVEYYHRHDPQLWTTKSMQFPSSMQLYTALHEEDAEEALLVFEKLFPVKDDGPDTS